MKSRRVIRRTIRRSGDGVNVTADVQAVVASNANERGARTGVRSKSTVRILQRDGRTEVTEEHETARED